MIERSTFWLAAASLAVTLPVAAVEPTYPDLVYAVVGDRPLHVDLYLPVDDSAAPRPVVVHVHGGGWYLGDRYPVPDPVLDLLDHGIAIASVQYRLSGQQNDFGGEPVIFPAQIHDVKGAVRWLRESAETYGLDPERVGAWGFSSGGHLATLLATSHGVDGLEGATGGNADRSSAVLGAADYFGPTDILHMNLDRTWPPGGMDHDVPGSPESRLVGWRQPGQGIGDIRAHVADPTAPYPDLVARCLAADPIQHVTADDAPCFVAHGTMDTTVPFAQSSKLVDALNTAGVATDWRPVDGAGHDWSTFGDVNVAAVQFFVDLFNATDADVNGDGTIDVDDLIAIIIAWGPCVTDVCPADADGSGVVDVDDIVAVILAMMTR